MNLKTIKPKERKKKHGLSGTPFYKVWRNMRCRCYLANDSKFKHYGGRGIKVCDRWLDFVNFKNDLYDSYLEHKKEHSTTTIERTNNDKDYSPENCCWATREEQLSHAIKSRTQLFLVEKATGKSFTSTLIRELDEGSWQKFRALCLKEDISANKAVKSLVYRAVRNGRIEEVQDE